MDAKSHEKEQAACPLCSCPTVLRMQLPHTSVRKCANRRCNLQFAFPQLDEEQLRAAYSHLYYPDAEGRQAAHYENTSDSILRQVLRKIGSAFGALAGKEILDYGCGTGSLCRVALEYGARPVGIEADPNARQAIRRAGLFAAYENLEALRKARGESRFDFIFLWEVIEHLREPWCELTELRKLLSPEGRIVISTPNAAGLKARLFPHRWDNYLNPTHFYYFAPASLRLAFERAGFQEIAQLHFTIRYPHHSAPRSAFHHMLLRAGLDGELLFTGRPRPSEILPPGINSK